MTCPRRGIAFHTNEGTRDYERATFFQIHHFKLRRTLVDIDTYPAKCNRT